MEDLLLSGQNHADSAGNPRGWRILRLNVKRESKQKLKGIFRTDSAGIFRRFPAEFLGIFGGFIGDKTVEDFRGILGESQEKSWEIYREIGGNLRDTAISLFCFFH